MSSPDTVAGDQAAIDVRTSGAVAQILLCRPDRLNCFAENMREELLKLLSGYAASPTTPAMVMVTHHVEEIPEGFTHVLLLREGRAVASGPIAETLTAESLSEAFGMPIVLTADSGRYAARAA